MKKILSLILVFLFTSSIGISALAYDSINAESDVLKVNNGKPIEVIVDSSANWYVPNASVTVIRGNDSQDHVNLQNGVSGTISADDPAVVLSQTKWFVSNYDEYDTFTASGKAPENVSTIAQIYTYKVSLTCTSLDDLLGLNNQTNDFLIIHVTVNPGKGTPEAPKDTEAPVITLNGSQVVTVEAGTEYIDQGASASDNVDGDTEH